MIHEIIVGNLGLVYSGTDEQEAQNLYDHYVCQSILMIGRACGEPVTWLQDHAIYQEHTPEPCVLITVEVKVAVSGVDTDHGGVDIQMARTAVAEAVTESLARSQQNGFCHRCSQELSLSVKDITIVITQGT